MDPLIIPHAFKYVRLYLNNLKCKIFYSYYFNKSVRTKTHLKTKTINFINDLFLYLSSNEGAGAYFDSTERISPTQHFLYEEYIDIIDYILKMEDSIKPNRIKYLIYLINDYINSILNDPFNVLFININIPDRNVLNSHFDKLGIVLNTLFKSSYTVDYLTEKEFNKIMVNYKTNFLNTPNIELFHNTGKLPKKYKQHKKIDIEL